MKHCNLREALIFDLGGVSLVLDVTLTGPHVSHFLPIPNFRTFLVGVIGIGPCSALSGRTEASSDRLALAELPWSFASTVSGTPQVFFARLRSTS